MMLLTKTIHVLALGLWFGTTIFFSFPVALSLFSTFEQATHNWPKGPPSFPLADDPRFHTDPRAWTVTDGPATPKPLFTDQSQLFKEYAGGAAGTVISPMFDWYFLFQAVCSVLTLATALAWWKDRSSRAHRARVVFLLLAFLTVCAGWPIERYVSHLRHERIQATDEVLSAAPTIPPRVYNRALEARAEFGRWHLYSLLLNFGTIALVTVGMALAAQLPAATPAASREEQISGTAALV